MNYEDIITVFIDILGFKDLLKQTIVKGEDQMDKIKEILSFLCNDLKINN